MTFAYYDWIAHHAEVRGGRIAQIDLATQRRFTYAQMDERVARLAQHLSGLGVGRGERVAVLAANSTDTLETQFACFRLGAIFTPLNIRLTVHELAFIVSDAAPAVLVHDDDFADMAADLGRRCGVAHRLGYGAAYEQAIAEAARLAQPARCAIDEVCTIMYTSGTTGKPKGSQTTHLMNLINAVNLGTGVFISQRSAHLCVLPLFHTGGLNCYVNPVFHAGGCNLVMRAFDPGEALRLIGDASVGLTHFFGVPSIYQFMAAHAAFAHTDFSRLLIAGVGGAPMPVPLLQAWSARGCTLVQGYGMTETSPAVLVLDAEDAARKAGSAGRPVLHGELRIVDAVGRDVARGDTGELWVRGPNITPGYWKRPEANKSSFTDGWLHTGDAARQDDEGFYYIVDRTRDMYISGGENVYPAEVEDVLYGLAAIAEAAVIAEPDATWGETGLAVVVTRSGHALTEAQVIAHCRERLARFKCPARVVFIDALPRNATGKVHKPTLRAGFAAKDSG